MKWEKKWRVRRNREEGVMREVGEVWWGLEINPRLLYDRI